MAFVSKVGVFAYFRLKTLQAKHTCGWTFKGYFASSNWVADKLGNKMRLGERMKIANVIQSVKENYMADISVTKAYWSRRKALEKLQGKAVKQYSKI